MLTARGLLLIASSIGLWSAGVLGQDKLPARGLGLSFTDPAKYNAVPLASAPFTGTLPVFQDLSNRFPLPGHQGTQGSCVGWAIAYALKSYQEAIERAWLPEGPTRTFSPSYIYNQVKGGQDCSGGVYFEDAFKLVQRDGVATLSDFPYDDKSCSAIPDSALRDRSRQYGITSWQRVNVQNEAEVKGLIASGEPVLIGMHVDDLLMKLGPGSTYVQYSGQSLGGHAVVLVGYDDRRSAFKLLNSWGREWGDNGFGWVSYRAFKAAVMEGYVIKDLRGDPLALQVLANARTPHVKLGSPLIVNAASPEAYSLIFSTPGKLLDAVGRTLQIVYRFAFFDGPPLLASDQETKYRDSRGTVAAASDQIRIVDKQFDISRIQVSIPYEAMNLQATKFSSEYNLNVVATVYVDNLEVGKTRPLKIYFKY